MKIYFPAAIRGGRRDIGIYRELIRFLETYGPVLNKHVGDHNVKEIADKDENPPYIYQRDMNWLKESDIVIAEVTTPSLGVGWEIGQAVNMGKKILCLYRGSHTLRLSAWVLGCPNLTLKTYLTIPEAQDIIKQFIHSL